MELLHYWVLHFFTLPIAFCRRFFNDWIGQAADFFDLDFHQSPGRIQSGGRDAPTPEGVPVTMISPLRSVICHLSMPVNDLAVEFGLSRKSLPPGGSSSAVTNNMGLNGPVSSKFLPMVHCGDLNW